MNKVETLAEALWHVQSSRFYTAEEKQRIAHKLSNKINKDGYLAVRSSEARSQLENKEKATRKILELVARSLLVPKKRKPTKLPEAVREKRLASKRKDAMKKEHRRPPGLDS